MIMENTQFKHVHAELMAQYAEDAMTQSKCIMQIGNYISDKDSSWIESRSISEIATDPIVTRINEKVVKLIERKIDEYGAELPTLTAKWRSSVL